MYKRKKHQKKSKDVKRSKIIDHHDLIIDIDTSKNEKNNIKNNNDDDDNNELYEKAKLYTDTVGQELLDKIFSTTNIRLEEAQLRSFNHMLRIGIQNEMRNYVVWSFRHRDEVWKIVITKSYMNKPQCEEANGIVHKQSIIECRFRDATYKSPIYVSMDLYVFSKRNPVEDSENAFTLTNKLDNSKRKRSSVDISTRSSSKTKRIRTDLIENSIVHQITKDAREQKEYEMENTNNNNNTEDATTTTEKQMTWLDIPEYHQKLKRAQDICRLSPYEINTYPYLIRFEHHPRQRLFELPISQGSIACHSRDSIDQVKDSLIATNAMMINGRNKPMILTRRMQYNHPFIREEKIGKQYTFYSEMRNSYPKDDYRSTQFKLFLYNKKKFEHEHLMCKLQYIDTHVPWLLLYRALNWLDDEEIEAAVLYTAAHFFNSKDKVVPFAKLSKLIQYSLNHQDAVGFKEQNQAFEWLGKRSQSEVNADSYREKYKRQQAQLKQNQLNKDDIVIKKRWYACREIRMETPVEELRRIGQSCVCKDVFPQVGSDQSSFLAKGMMLSYVTAKLLLKVLGMFDDGCMNDDGANYYSWRFQYVQFAGDWIVTKNIRPGLNGQMKSGHKVFVTSLIKNEPISIQTVFDHKASSKWIHKFFATGIAANVQRSAPGAGNDEARPISRENKTDKTSSKSSNDKTGLCQVENGTNIISKISQAQRIAGTAGNAASRQIAGNWRFTDLSETPEGPDCGVIQPQTLFARCSTVRSTDVTLQVLLFDKYKITSISDIARNIKQEWKNTQELKSPDDRLVMTWSNGNWLGMMSSKTVVETTDYLNEVRYAMFGEAFLTMEKPKVLRSLSLYSNVGRMLSCLLVVDKLPRLLSRANHNTDVPLYKILGWDELLREGFVVYVDAKEQDHMLIALNAEDLILRGKAKNGLKFTHLEVSLVTAFGMSSSQIPFPEHNQAPRNTYQANMGKQAMSAEWYDFCNRVDTMTHALIYPNRPQVRTFTLDFLRMSDLPCTVSGIVAIFAQIDNQDDAVVLNQSSIHRGFMRSKQYTTTTAQEKRYGSMHNVERFGKPSRLNCLAMKAGNYNTLDIDGLPHAGTHINVGDALIGKISTTAKMSPNSSIHIVANNSTIVNQEGNTIQSCCSVMAIQKHSGIVDQTILTTDLEGMLKAKVKIRKVCPAIISDKFSSRHSQKGTTSRTVRDDEMPYNHRGQHVDIAVSVMSVSSRMTLADVLERFIGKASVANNTSADGTAFSKGYKTALNIATEYSDEIRETNTGAIGNPVFDDSYMDVDDKRVLIGESLKRSGYQRHGNERFYNPTTGKLIGGDSKHGEGQIYTGIVDYQKLTHRGEDKCTRRAKGSRHLVTRQPIDGGQRGGGMRFGEMETGCANAHGAGFVIHDRTNISSDAQSTYICDKCKSPHVQAYIPDKLFYCKVCATGEHVKQTIHSYGFTSLHQSLFSMGMNICYSTSTMSN